MAYTKEYFLEKAHEVHGEKYDYSKVNYINQTEKVCIICPKHGEFWQSPYLHLRGRGCNQCAIDRRRMTKETFIQKAKEIHGDKYDYSKVEYKTTEDKVCIICPEHGEFWQTPHMHIGMDKNGCPKCSKTRGSGENGTLTTEEFIEKARKVHGDRYDYSKVDYKNSETKICIICSKHGEFWQIPYGHLTSSGCLQCQREANKMSFDKFVEKARKIHGDKYQYLADGYTCISDKVKIICPVHGEFEQVGSSHINQKHGCSQCFEDKRKTMNLKTTEQFIADAKKVHGDRYDYSKVEYKTTHIPVIIGCSEHGDFKQIPCDHLHGCGCPKCGMQFGITEQKVENQLRGVFDTVVCQYRPKFLHGKTSSLSLDFYLPEYNAAVEYHGAQHFTPIERFGGEEGFAKIQERDKRKYEKCLNEGIQIFYLTYEKLPDDFEYFAPVYDDFQKMVEDIKKKKIQED